jgi:hypothetical protein
LRIWVAADQGQGNHQQVMFRLGKCAALFEQDLPFVGVVQGVSGYFPGYGRTANSDSQRMWFAISYSHFKSSTVRNGKLETK